MNHQREASAASPSHLPLESHQLLLLELAAPIEVESHLADGDNPVEGHSLHGIEHLLEIVSHLFGMKPYHWESESRELPADVEHPPDRRQVDGRHKEILCPGLSRPLYDLAPIAVELLAVEVDMCVDESHQ